jgi:hypothetical protein
MKIFCRRSLPLPYRRYRPLGSFARTPAHAFDDPFGVIVIKMLHK